jgi:small subunit ribosomal protein S3
MAVEKKFVQDGFTKALVNEYLAKELERAGYGGMQMNRTPMGTQITVYAEKPGMVIGKGGKLIRKITRDLDRKFRLDNPQVDVQDVGKGDLNSQVVANRLASSLERGWYFRKAGQSMLRRVMDSGARGCEIVISGKLTGPRSRTEKFIAGYIKHSGKPAIEIVDKGYSVAVKKLGVIGCQVRIIPPDVTPPDQFTIKKVVVPEAEAKAETPAPATDTKVAEEKRSELDKLLEAEPGAPEAVPEVVEEVTPSEEKPAASAEETSSPEQKPSASTEESLQTTKDASKTAEEAAKAADEAPSAAEEHPSPTEESER